MNQEILLIDAPNGKLEIDAIWQAGERSASDGLAIICHPNPMAGGTMNNKVVSTMYRFCRDCGMDVLRFNFRGVGQSTGTTGNGIGELTDALTVLRFALTKTKARKLWLGGFSFGGFVACQVADVIAKQDEFSEINLHNLALIAPSVVRNDTSVLTLPTERTFLVYGAHDELVSPSALAEFARVHQLPNQVIDTGHFFHAKLVELRQALEQLTIK